MRKSNNNSISVHSKKSFLEKLSSLFAAESIWKMCIDFFTDSDCQTVSSKKKSEFIEPEFVCEMEEDDDGDDGDDGE